MYIYLTQRPTLIFSRQDIVTESVVWLDRDVRPLAQAGRHQVLQVTFTGSCHIQTGRLGLPLNLTSFLLVGATAVMVRWEERTLFWLTSLLLMVPISSRPSHTSF